MIEPSTHPYPRFDYPLYFWRLWKKFGFRAFVKQFRFHTRRPFSRNLIRRHAPNGFGIEIGVGATTIAPLKRTILTDGYHSHADSQSIATHHCMADRIEAGSETFDFVISEHVLEHLPNPIRALREWMRLLRHGGTLFLFLPHRDRTFDRHRDRTPLRHLLDDERNQVSETDSTHLQDWKENVLDRGLAPHYSSIPLETQPGLGILHHHVWITEDIEELLEALGMKVVFKMDQCPDRLDSFVVVAEKR